MFKSKERKAQEARERLVKESRAAGEAAARDAKNAYDAGETVFQYMSVISSARGEVVPMAGAFTTDERGPTKGGLGKALGGRYVPTPIGAIEREGWTLIDAGYVYRQTHAESRDKFLASGQEEAYSGQILGVFTFRRADASTM